MYKPERNKLFEKCSIACIGRTYTKIERIDFKAKNALFSIWGLAWHPHKDDTQTPDMFLIFKPGKRTNILCVYSYEIRPVGKFRKTASRLEAIGK